MTLWVHSSGSSGISACSVRGCTWEVVEARRQTWHTHTREFAMRAASPSGDFARRQHLSVEPNHGIQRAALRAAADACR
jgi:hypothetical protein